MANITVQFTYDMPEKRGKTSREGARQQTWTYTGPDRLWVFVHEDDNTLAPMPAMTLEQDGDTYNPPFNIYKVEVDPTRDPIVADYVWEDPADDNIEEVTWTGPDGREYADIAYLPPQLAYDNHTITYDRSSGTWNYEFATPPWDTWEQVRSIRNGLIEATDERIGPDVPADVKAPWLTYRQELRDITDTWAEALDLDLHICA